MFRMLNLCYDPIYTEGLDPSVRFPRERYQLLAARLKEISSIHIQRPPLATREQIGKHTMSATSISL